MDLRLNKKNNDELGLTFIEVLIAILILGMSISTILGLQFSVMEQALQDKNQRIAMLIARNVLSAIEIDPSSFSNKHINKPASSIIKDFIGNINLDKEELAQYNNFNVELNIQETEIPMITGENIDFIAMKEIHLTVFWGDLDNEQTNVVYFSRAETPQS